MWSENSRRKLADQLAKEAKRTRTNRVYYPDCFKTLDVYQTGLVQDDRKSAYDWVQLEPHKNELIKFYGLDQHGSHFELWLALLSLDQHPERAHWRLGSVEFTYNNVQTECKYSFSAQQLVDYSAKLGQPDELESRSIYKVGPLTLEVSLPFSLSRLLFNGLLERECRGRRDLVSARLSISTHPTSDKFDFQYRFSARYLANTILKCTGRDAVAGLDSNGTGHKRGSSAGGSLQQAKSLDLRDRLKSLIEIAREDRIDQTFMFQGSLELFSGDTGDQQPAQRFVMWGAKVKRFLDATGAEQRTDFESLYVWNECGQAVHLTRPQSEPELLYGFATSAFDYASHLYEAKMFKRDGQIEVGFDQLASFERVPVGTKIQLRAFKLKDFTIDFESGADRAAGSAQPIAMNNFKGWALFDRGQAWFASQLKQARTLLLSLPIGDDPLASRRLASELLLGGKGYSLVQLHTLAAEHSFADLLHGQAAPQVSVPDGLVVTSVAYELWLSSSALIRTSIDELDGTRRALAARSFYVNPLSDKHLAILQHQQILKDQCQKTRLVLSSCPLPVALKQHLHAKLTALFGQDALLDPLDDDQPGVEFAVRSSAVGEDSLATSAAGQMKTVLGVRGFHAICQAVVECWVSQFDQEAVTYKSQNGLPFNLPMAVVVQQLVRCELAGVGATCQPLTGDHLQLEITANRGLGDGVVAGKQTDTVRVSLSSLTWDQQRGHALDLLKLDADVLDRAIDKKQQDCCLSSKHIVALANLLTKIRRKSAIKDREVEWGITGAETDRLRIHLLQSRPLTNLARLTAYEIDHEFDSGQASPDEICSRANLGEVFPGALCLTTISHFLQIARVSFSPKPFESNHTFKSFCADSFAFYAHMANMVFTHTDALTRFGVISSKEREAAESMISMMLGSTKTSETEARQELFNIEHINPLTKLKPRGFGAILLLDLGFSSISYARGHRQVSKLELTSGLCKLDELIDQTERPRVNMQLQDELKFRVLKDIKELWKRITCDIEPIRTAWMCHINGTILSMAFNTACMKFLSNQSEYPDDTNSPEILNDFSILMRASEEQTESADISKLLDTLVSLLHEEGHLDKTRNMDTSKLYAFLSSPSNTTKSAKAFRKFMKLNGHRAFKEFDFSTLTWADDPSYIIKSLALRIRNGPSSLNSRIMDNNEKDLANVLSKITRRRAILTGYLLPRARLAVLRRERSKSLLILMIDKYRKAFRHLGCLLCLAGRLPSVDLVNNLALEELDTLVRREYQSPSLNSKLIFKARRRQQRLAVLNQIKWPQPTLKFSQVVETIQYFNEPKDQQQAPVQLLGQDETNQVRGLISCAGCVTGRALVVQSIDDMDQIKPNDILITYSIDISWSVYFFTLAGIVTEIGGIVSHGAVVAREYGIPTICTAMGACSKFKTGQLVTLDANRGMCYLLDDSPVVGHSNAHLG